MPTRRLTCPGLPDELSRQTAPESRGIHRVLRGTAYVKGRPREVGAAAGAAGRHSLGVEGQPAPTLSLRTGRAGCGQRRSHSH